MNRGKNRREFLKSTLGAGVLFLGAKRANGATNTAEGSELTANMIWVAGNTPALTSDVHAVFVKQFTLTSIPTSAILNLFAYQRYRLYVNGVYQGRGASRYENTRPEYDARNITAALRTGENFIAILVDRYGASPSEPISRIMAHDPALAAALEMTTNGTTTTILTDTTWVSMIDSSFGSRGYAWTSIPESVNAIGAFNYTNPVFNSSGFAASVEVTGPLAGSPAFSTVWPRTIPLQAETLVPWTGSVPTFPLTLSAGSLTLFQLPKLIQGYYNLVISSAQQGSSIGLIFGDPDGNATASNSYTCSSGAAAYMCGDTFSFKNFVIQVNSGQITLSKVQAFTVGYPYSLLASFNSNDSNLNALWQTSANSGLLLTEDAYVDCADRERGEWMDCGKPGYDVTSVMMAGPPLTGSTTPYYGDPRLLKDLLRRTYLTAQSNGMMYAITCTDRQDLHLIMEDRMCDWVAYLRRYYDATGDAAFVEECWPYLKGLMGWFMNAKDSDGLVFAREWEVWDNPLRYEYCEGAGLNAFVYRALNDAVYLGNATGFTSDATAFAADAAALATAFNTVLWSSAAGAYYGAYIGPNAYYDPRAAGTGLGIGPFPEGLYQPTIQANLFALQSNIVPASQIASVTSWILNNLSGATEPMSLFYLYAFFYNLHTDADDTAVLNSMRSAFAPQIASDWATSFEFLNGSAGSSKCHVYGEGPGYYLTAYVLGVRRVGPVANNSLLIEPRTGGLTSAQGVALTEFGTVPVSWTNNQTGAISLTCTVPAGPTTTLSLYQRQGSLSILIDGATVTGTLVGKVVQAPLSAGSHTIQYPAAAAEFTVAPAAPTFTLAPNTGGTIGVTITPASGFSGSVTLSLSGLPKTGSSTFLANSATSFTLVIYLPAGVTPGTYPLTITGTSGSNTASAPLSLVVPAAATPGFTISANASFTLAPGTGGTTPVTITPTNGFNGSVSLSLSGLPSSGGTSYTFLANSSTSFTLVVYAPASVPAGTYTVTINGVSGNITASTKFSFIVT